MGHAPDKLPTARERVAAIILAGGLARRMGGGDKGLRELAGTTMLRRVIDRIAPQVETLAINANGDPARFDAFALPVVADPLEGNVGPLVGVLAGLRWAAGTSPDVAWVVSAPSDAPFLPADLVARFVACARENPRRIVLAQSNGRLHPVVGLWPVALADDLEKALRGGVRKVLDWTDHHDTMACAFAPRRIGSEEVDPFFNANHPDELEEAERWIVAEGERDAEVSRRN